ncbi:MAG: hydrolase TatD [Thermomicrobiales bacterium]|nr:MAG: hydrolase TatD [Thermomicrobiales bacterium]
MTTLCTAPVYVDTHAHLDDGRFDHDLDEVLAAAASAGVKHVINIGYRPARWPTTIALARRRSDISFTLGVHPHHADEWSPETARLLEEAAVRERPVAIGETGLDYFRDLSDRSAQRRAFLDQLAIAARLRLPVVLHLRGEIEQDVRAILACGPPVRAVFHSFDGSAALASFILERGDIFGIGGLLTRPTHQHLRDLVRDLPLDRIVLETDAPYLTPAGIRDRRNSPINIPHIAKALAAIKELPAEEIAARSTRTAVELFGLPHSLIAHPPGGSR